MAAGQAVVAAALALACLQLACAQSRARLAPAPGPFPEDLTLDSRLPSSNYYSGPFKNLTLAPLPYPTDALEPFIDNATMVIHHNVHNKAYVTNANNALATSNYFVQHLTLVGLNHQVNNGTLGSCTVEPSVFRTSASATAFRNNAGGAYNHAFFFACMAKPNGTNNAPTTGGPLAKALDAKWGNFTSFKKAFTEAGVSRFGSGFAWLIVQPSSNNELVVLSTPNQDNPVQGTATAQGIPILNLDVWEHAYYLKYNASRPLYIENWWNVVNWPYVEGNYAGALQGQVPVFQSS